MVKTPWRYEKDIHGRTIDLLLLLRVSLLLDYGKQSVIRCLYTELQLRTFLPV